MTSGSVSTSARTASSRLSGSRAAPGSSGGADIPIASAVAAGPAIGKPVVFRPSNGLRGAVRIELVGRDLLADLLERAADQARDVHLRDPDLLGDLRLCQALEEAEVEDRALAVVERPEARREHGAVLRDLVGVLDLAERLERVELLPVLGAPAGGERERRVGAAGLERLEHLFLLHP